MKHHLLFFLLTILAQPFAGHAADAESRATEELQIASAVFVGEVLSVRAFDQSLSAVTFRVSRSWKGVDKAQTKVWTAHAEGLCGYPFTKGETYLVYAYGKARNTSLCSRTKRAIEAAKEIEELGLPRFMSDRDVRR